MSPDNSSGARRWFPMSPILGPFDSPPPEVAVQVEFGAASHRGPLRRTNEDHYLVMRLGRHQETLLTSLPAREIPQRFDEFAYGMVIADGMGGAGEAASRLAIATLAHLVVHFGKWNLRIDEPIAQEVMERVERFYRSVDSTLLQAGRLSPRGLQSSLTAVYTAGSELFFAHVGHSRAYLLRDGELLQLTHDHTLDAEPPHEGESISAATEARDLHHILTDVIGGTGPSSPRMDVDRCSLLDDDVILLCTNGLTDVVDGARIADELRRHRTPDDQCRALIDLAIKAAGNDDATALVAHYRIGGETD